MQFVDVCVATYKRPKLLNELLCSLVAQSFNSLKIRIIVVDNDRDESARPVVENSRTYTTVEIVYDVEPCQSITLARNRALEHISADYVAFVDDDETVPTDWLTTMLATMENYDADVVFGPVEGLLPLDAPQWVRSQPIFNRPKWATGTQLEHGGSGNVLIRKVALGQPTQLFDPAFGLTGGEDTEFFHRLHNAGRRLVWCAEAVVTENVPHSRLTLQWIRQRGFRGGQSFVRIFIRRYSFKKKAMWFVKKILHLIVAIISLPLVRVLSYSIYVRLTVGIMGTIGQLSGMYSNNFYEEYRSDRHK